MELTKLQRLGISSLLVFYKFSGNQWLDAGTIKFVEDSTGKYINMYVYPNRRELELQFTLQKNENIDCGLIYKFAFDNENGIFRINELMDGNA